MSFLERAWSKRAAWLWALWPVSLLYQFVAARSKQGRLAQQKSAPGIPVVIVGNIAVGGTGKTPFLIALCKHLQSQGRKPGIISRGYGGKSAQYPLQVDADTAPTEAGDEPVLLAQRTGCPVIVDPDRVNALEFLLANHDVDIVLSDDGLQHYALPRHLEICLVDGQRMLGNGLCLPAGFLREPPRRLQEVDLVVINNNELQPADSDDEEEEAESAPVSDGESLEEKRAALAASSGAALSNIYTTSVIPASLINLATGKKRPFGGAPFNMGTRLHCVTGIGNPERFIGLLQQLPYPLTPHIFPDHHPFSAEDFDSLAIDSTQPIVMTEKDGIKCRNFAAANFWYLEINMELDPKLLAAFDARLQQAIGD
jgi:tetraacyldisaccharide 4'-kinase